MLPPEFLFNAPEWFNMIEVDYWMVGTLIYEVFYDEPFLPPGFPLSVKLTSLMKKLGFPQYHYDFPYSNKETYD